MATHPQTEPVAARRAAREFQRIRNTRRYVRAQGLLRMEFERLDLNKLCAACPDPCCACVSFAQVLESGDLAVLPQAAAASAASTATPCCHLTARGCDLPSQRRPWVRVAHTCDRWEAALSSQEAGRLDRMFARFDSSFAALARIAPTGRAT